MIEEYTRVRTLVEKSGFPVGTVGVVVSMYASGAAYEVEVWDDSQYPVDVVTYRANEIEVFEDA